MVTAQGGNKKLSETAMSRVTKLFSIMSSIFLLIMSFHTYGERLSISQEYNSASGSTFVNTTPQSGFCIEHAPLCTDGKTFSLSLHLTATLMKTWILANAAPRDGVYIKLPGVGGDVRVINAEGKITTVHFRIVGLAANYNTHYDWDLTDHINSWVGGSFATAPSPCTSSGIGVALTRDYQFMWRWPKSAVACYKTAAMDLENEPYLLNELSIIYELTNASPQLLVSGDYTGTLHYSVGPGGDIDFGDAFVASDTSGIDIDFRLTVKNEFKITTTADDRQVALQPCKPGKICTPDEGEANWERWMVSRVTPQLTGRSNFGITSTGNFTVYLACADGQVGQDCALKSDNTGQLVPFRASLNLPTNIVDSTTGATVVQRHLNAGKDPSQNIFTTKSAGQDQKGSIDFLVPQRDVEAMLSTRPDTYRGGATVIFDQSIN
ncbi:hypothetical protein [Kosakonia sp. YIM B13587]|uniref:hypothetical protein n=1 Tax=Kosakonia sp. YIM B13587 TaxID=3366288 RepID=UPI0036D32335